jgi:hypothetical protein
MKKIIRLKTTLFLLLVSGVAYGQVFTDYWYGSAADAGMGGSGTAVSADLWSPDVNPAGLSEWKTPGFAVDYSQPFSRAFTKNSRAVLALPLPGNFGVVALRGFMSRVTYGGNDLTSEASFGLSHAFYLQKDLRSSLSVGYNLNYLQVDYGTTSAGVSGDGSDGVNLGSGSAWGIDVGMKAGLRSRAWAGFFLKNINNPALGTSGTAQSVPAKIAIGIGYQPYFGMTTTWEIEKVLGRDEYQVQAGLEYYVLEWLVLRTGLSHEPSQLTMGTGIRTGWVDVDYALITHPVLPLTHMFSLRLQMNRQDR